MTSHYEQFVVSLVAFGAVFIGTNDRPPQARCYVKHLADRPYLKHLFSACGRAHYDLLAFAVNWLLFWTLVVYIGTLSLSATEGSFAFFYLLLVKYLATRLFHLSHYQKTKRQLPVGCALLLYVVLVSLVVWVLFSLLLFGGSFWAVVASFVLVPVGVWYAAHSLWAALLLDHLRRLPPQEMEPTTPPPPPIEVVVVGEVSEPTVVPIDDDFDAL